MKSASSFLAAWLLWILAVTAWGFFSAERNPVDSLGFSWFFLSSAAARACCAAFFSLFLFSLAGLVLLGFLHKKIHCLRDIPFIDFALVAWLPLCGTALTLLRVIFVLPEMDWLFAMEPFLLSLLIPGMLFSWGRALSRMTGLLGAAPACFKARFAGGFAVENLLGAASLAALLWGLALMQLFSPSLLWLTALFPAAWLGSVRIFQKTPRCASRAPRGKTSLPALVALAGILTLLSASFLLSTLPPDDSDELRYHLSIPKRHLENGGWVEIKGQNFAHFPLGMEMLFSVPLSLDWLRAPGDRHGFAGGGKMVHLWFFILCLLAIRAWIVEITGKGDSGEEASCLGMFAFAAIPFAPVLASWAFVDFGSALGWLISALVGWVGIGSHSERKQTQCLRIILLAVGWSLMVKYTSLAWWAMLGICLCLFSLRTGLRQQGNLRRFTGRGLLYLAVPLLIASPWLIHNFITTGNPFAPLLSGLFGSGFTPIQKAFYNWHAGMKGDLNVFREMDALDKLRDLLLLPFKAVFMPEKFENNPIGGMLILTGPLAAWFLAAFDSRSRNRQKWYYAALSMMLFLLWALTYRDPRFAIPLWGMLFVGIAAGLANLASVYKPDRGHGLQSNWKSRALIGFAIFWGVNQCSELWLRACLYYPAILGKETQAAYLTREGRIPILRAVFEAEEIRKGADSPPKPILLMGQEQSYYFSSPLQGNDYFDGPDLAELFMRSHSIEAVSAELRKEGFKWIWINHATLEGSLFNLMRNWLFLKNDLTEASRLFKKNPQLIDFDSVEEIVHRAENLEAFRRYHAWLILHPGFREVELKSLPAQKPVSMFYKDWMKWPELKGVSAQSLPRRDASLLVAE